MLCDDILSLVGEHVLDIRSQEANRRAICDEIKQIKEDPYAFGIEGIDPYEEAFKISDGDSGMGFERGPLNFATGSRKDWGTDREFAKCWESNNGFDEADGCIYAWNFLRDDDHLYE